MIIHQLQQENWGVCGFVSALQAAHANAKKIEIDGKPLSSKFNMEVATRQDVLATSHSLLKHFIHIFDNNCSSDKATSIVAFTRQFGEDFRKPDKTVSALSDYCGMMYNDSSFLDTTGSKKPALGFAMTPEGMDFLLKSILSFKINPFRRITASEWKDIKEKDKGLAQFKNVIAGFSREKADTPDNYYGLKHWVYIDKDGYPYSWGSKYDNLNDFFKQTNYERISHVFNVGND